MTPPRGTKVDTWRWIPGGEPCGTCAGMAGDYEQCPGPPHPNCHCQCIHIERQINPRGPKQPYQVGIQLKGYGAAGGPDRWVVSVTCMRPAGDNGDEEYDAENGGEGDAEWETGETHAGEIDIPSSTGAGMSEKAEEMLYTYAEGLYENYCIGYA
jgi:hypothetical protein